LANLLYKLFSLTFQRASLILQPEGWYPFPFHLARSKVRTLRCAPQALTRRRPRRRGRAGAAQRLPAWGPELCARRPDITVVMVDTFLSNMYRARADFVYTVTRDFVRGCQTPILVLPDDVPAHPLRRHGNSASRGERASEPLPAEGHPG
jgi:hypothetical protein